MSYILFGDRLWYEMPMLEGYTSGSNRLSPEGQGLEAQEAIGTRSTITPTGMHSIHNQRSN